MSTPYIDVDTARKKLEYYCAYQERCHKEVLQKLKELGMQQQASDHIIAHLIAENYLNEERFSIAFARGKHRIKHWGKIRIERELKWREISAYNIKKALKLLNEEDYFSNFDTLSSKKWLEITEKDLRKKQQKWTAYWMRKGFENNLIYDKLNELIRDEKK